MGHTVTKSPARTEGAAGQEGAIEEQQGLCSHEGEE